MKTTTIAVYEDTSLRLDELAKEFNMSKLQIASYLITAIALFDTEELHELISIGKILLVIYKLRPSFMYSTKYNLIDNEFTLTATKDKDSEQYPTIKVTVDQGKLKNAKNGNN